MRRATLIEKDGAQIATVEDLTGVFESIASTQIAKVKNKVALSKEFFQLLWSRYSAIRIDPKTRITYRQQREGNGKTAYVIISAEAGLSGDIDQRLIEIMLQKYDSKNTDIIVLGTHGATQLTQRGVPFSRYFQVPESDEYIDVTPVVKAVIEYSSIIVYYEEYVSLGVQEIQTMNLITNLQDMSEDVPDEDAITIEDTIFEPSLNQIAESMEMTMMMLALNQTILESSLAQAASRFNAMTVAKKRASELLSDFRLEYHRAKRSEADRRLREVMTSLKKKRQRLGARG